MVSWALVAFAGATMTMNGQNINCVNEALFQERGPGTVERTLHVQVLQLLYDLNRLHKNKKK